MTELKVHASSCDGELMVQQPEEMRSAFVIRLKKAAEYANTPAWGLGARLASITNRTPKAASKWLNGESMPSRASMQAIAEAFKVRLEWLQYGVGLMIDGSETSYPRAIAPARQIRENVNVWPVKPPHREMKEYPLISWIAAGCWAESCDNYQPGDGQEFIASTENAGDHGYWLEVKGDSMVPPDGFAFNDGTRILVRPEGFDLISGKLYVAKLIETGETTFKQYVRDAGIEYLKPLNPTYRTIVIDENVRIIGRVIDARPPKSLL